MERIILKVVDTYIVLKLPIIRKDPGNGSICETPVEAFNTKLGNYHKSYVE
jgi:hypothetical protein